MQVIEGWLDAARRVPSENYNTRPRNEVSALVLHSISLPPGRFGGDAIERLFTNTLVHDAHPYFKTLIGLRVSAHLLVRRDGEVVQFVPFDKRAWHAGRSCWHDGHRERADLNDFTIGIELEGDEVQPYRDLQYWALSQAVRALMIAYPALVEERITSHARIAPLRKSDPGAAFDWAYFRQCLHHEKVFV